MPYIKTVWVTGDVISEAKANNWETQYEEAVRLVGVYTFGSRDTYLESSISYRTGFAANVLVPGSTYWVLDLAQLSGHPYYKLQAMMRVDNAAGVGNVALFNLSAAPDTACSGSLLTGTGNTTGELLTSSAITFSAGTATYGIKSKINNAAYGVSVWGVRIIRATTP